MLTGGYRAFGWNEIPDSFEPSPITVNRRFREWTESGVWLKFWDALHHSRHGKPRVPKKVVTGRLKSPIPMLIAELERAYKYFNASFFGGKLSEEVVIAIEPPGKRVSGGRTGHFSM